MKRFELRTRTAKYTWLQVFSLGLSFVFYQMGSIPAAIALLLLGTIFGVLVMMIRIREAKTIVRQQPRRRR